MNLSLNRILFAYGTNSPNIVVENIFGKYFVWFGGLGPKYNPFLIYQRNASNQKVTMSLWFSTLVKVYIERIKNRRHHLLKMNRSHYIAILLKSWMGLDLVSILHNRVEKLDMLAKRCTNIWPNLILILPRILKKQLKVELVLCNNVYHDIWSFEVHD